MVLPAGCPILPGLLRYCTMMVFVGRDGVLRPCSFCAHAVPCSDCVSSRLTYLESFCAEEDWSRIQILLRGLASTAGG